MNNKSLAILLIVFCPTLQVKAADSSVVIYTRDGYNSTYSLNEHPKVLFDLNFVLLKTDNTQIEYPIAQIRKIVFEESTSVKHLSKSEKGYIIHDNQIHIEGLGVGSRVLVYNIGGMLCASYMVGTDGYLDISLDALPSSIYLVKTSDVTIKIFKK